MGKQHTKTWLLRMSVSMVLMVFCCLMMFTGFCLLNNSYVNESKVGNLTLLADINSDINWVDIRSSGFLSTIGGTTHYISSAGELAYFNYELTNSGNSNNAVDYSGHTFILENDIKLDEIYTKEHNKYITPLWTPIEIGNKGKNRNIIFNGNGHSIIGLTMKYDDDVARNVGFFAEMVGGVFENVVFKDTKIIYNYHADSIAANDPLRPDAPVELSIGVIAGAADTTYINNVTIENPSVILSTENTNGHNFYLGAAVGKLLFSSGFVDDGEGGEKIQSINTITPNKWGIDTVNVLKTDDPEESSGINLEIRAGTDGVTYGLGTNVYFGGLVGVNISSKIINSTLRDVAFNTNFELKDDELLDGMFYVGGLVGLNTQITTNKDLIVAAGLYNNLIIDIQLCDILPFTNNNYCGQLVGLVYSGGWVYNNIVIGEMPYENFWGRVCNSKIRLIDNHNCIANIVGSIDENYYLNGHNASYPNCGFGRDINDSDEFDNLDEFLYCTKHNTRSVYLIDTQDDTGTVTKMEKYNFYFESTSDSSYAKFCNLRVTVIDENNYERVLDAFQLLSYFDQTEGYMYHAILPIVKYEVGLTVNKFNPETGEDATLKEKRIDAIYQFRTWKLDEVKNEPVLSDYTGLNYTVCFSANSPKNSNAYWVVDNEGYEERISEINTGRTYQLIYRPEDPQCDGYEFLGWTVDGLEEGDAEWLDMRNHGLFDDDGYYIFAKEQILSPNRRFLANWKIKEFTVHFVVRERGQVDIEYTEYPTEIVTYGRPIIGPAELPKSKQGYSCVGWFLEENLPNEGEDANSEMQWIMGFASDDLMPGRDITLYTGWIDNFSMLNSLIYDTKYQQYYQNYEYYFEDVLGLAFYNAYSQALEYRANNDNSNTDEVLGNLQNAFKNLKIDPKKLLALPAFNDSRMENACPFLYDYEARMMYSTFKDTVQRYVESDETDDTNIEAYIKNYDRLNELFYNLQNNLNQSVAMVGGVGSSEVQNLIKKYYELQIQDNALVKEKYDSNSLALLDETRIKLDELWMSEASNPNIKDVELAMVAYENALKNLKPAGATNSGNAVQDKVENSNQAPQLPISPVVLGVLVVMLLLAGVGGYIGVDVILAKRRVAKNEIKTAEKQVEQFLEDEDTYI